MSWFLWKMNFMSNPGINLNEAILLPLLYFYCYISQWAVTMPIHWRTANHSKDFSRKRKRSIWPLPPQRPQCYPSTKMMRKRCWASTLLWHQTDILQMESGQAMRLEAFLAASWAAFLADVSISYVTEWTKFQHPRARETVKEGNHLCCSAIWLGY